VYVIVLGTLDSIREEYYLQYPGVCFIFSVHGMEQAASSASPSQQKSPVSTASAPPAEAAEATPGRLKPTASFPTLSNILPAELPDGTVPVASRILVICISRRGISLLLCSLSRFAFVSRCRACMLLKTATQKTIAALDYQASSLGCFSP
jgi:hypothetical protein